MVLDARFPHLPEHALGFVYGRGQSEIVVWADDKSIQARPEGEASEADLAEFTELLDSLRGRGLSTWAAAHRRILAGGWEDRGMLRYNAQSALLLQDAVALGTMADEMWVERMGILDQSRGRPPEEGSDGWGRWVLVTARRTAAARGARALALASVEALINELLAARHPGHYEEWEVQGRKRSFWKKLRGLLELKAAGDAIPDWFQELADHAELRDAMLHHRPEWILDDRDDESVEPDLDMTQERLHETLTAVGDAIAGLFALYGAEAPETHRSDWVSRIAG